VDFAKQMKWLVHQACPDANVVRVVLDNLNVHVKASLYVAFAPCEARRIPRNLDFHYTPKHSSWLNVAECELAVLASQCLARRLGDIEYARSEIAAWERQRNLEGPTVNWHFTVDQARRKLRRLYPDPA
jgi:DDE superfamily endonuclease